MTPKEKLYATMYMDMAKRVALMSHCTRAKVGVIMIKSGKIIAEGWNGMPEGMDNCCEIPATGKTRPEVIHAEENAILKLARSHESSLQSVMFTTLAPCIHCAKLIFNAGVEKMFYADIHPNHPEGLQYLKDRGVVTVKI